MTPEPDLREGRAWEGQALGQCQGGEKRRARQGQRVAYAMALPEDDRCVLKEEERETVCEEPMGGGGE